jgi:NAD(P)-dependent dehydrogenase (short-subunit alcohol dehydrogenase family)
MQQQKSGSIITTASVAGYRAGGSSHAYSTAKAAVLHYTTVAAAELSAHRIRINAIVPGFIATRIFGGLMQLDHAQAGALAAQIAERSGTANPIGRSGMPRDIAEAALFLASDAAGFITGTHITVDGGLTIGPRHSWDANVAGPMSDALGLSPEQLRALRAQRMAKPS